MDGAKFTHFFIMDIKKTRPNTFDMILKYQYF